MNNVLMLYFSQNPYLCPAVTTSLAAPVTLHQSLQGHCLVILLRCADGVILAVLRLLDIMRLSR